MINEKITMNVGGKFFIVVIMAMAACNTNPDVVQLNPSQAMMVDSAGGSCPYLTKDARNNIVLSWVRNQLDSTYIFCYAVSEDDGKTFSQPVMIPGSNTIHAHPENLPKVVFKQSGEIMAVWGTPAHDHRNAYAGMIYYAQSFDNGKNWTTPSRLVKDSSGYDQRYFDVKVLPNDEVAIVWLDNRKTTSAQGSAVYLATTTGRNGFMRERLIAQPACECCRTGIAVDGDQLHIVYRAIVNDSIRDVVHSMSDDNGRSFSKPVKISNDNWVINGCPHSGPSMAVNESGIQFAWYTGSMPNGVYYTSSTDHGHTFSPRDTVSNQARHPQIATIANGNLITVWDEPVQANGKHYSRIGIEQRSREGKKNYFGFLTPENGYATYPTLISHSNSVVVAYCVGDNKNSRIAVQMVALK